VHRSQNRKTLFSTIPKSLAHPLSAVKGSTSLWLLVGDGQSGEDRLTRLDHTWWQGDRLHETQTNPVRKEGIYSSIYG
jgi:hypothetical protein